MQKTKSDKPILRSWGGALLMQFAADILQECLR
nr:MAG TPA: hypothetical protein [Caudoviricetes sp.]